jgi:ornithine carbamoyltransferase
VTAILDRTTTVRHLLSLDALDEAALHGLVDRAAAFAAGARPEPSLRGRIVGLYFKATSTRTRTAFSAASLRLGAQIISYGPGDLQLNTGETTGDTAQVLSGMLDVLVARTAGPASELADFAAQPSMAVINAMSETEHPTQAITDLATIQATFGSVRGIRVLYVGEGNSTAAALALGLARFPGVHLDLRTPAGYGVPAAVLTAAGIVASANGTTIRQSHDMDGIDIDADVVYTSRWQTTGTCKADPKWRQGFAPFKLTADVLDANPIAVVMHDLPAHRGEEIEAEVLDGPRSIAFTQAQAKLTGAMAVLEWCVGGGSPWW